jgi:hypothetical protein
MPREPQDPRLPESTLPAPAAISELPIPTPSASPAGLRRELAERILTSTLFEKSPRLRSFLRFICEMELTGRRLSINEHEIGVHVFGRPVAYNPGEDSIVRSQARFLRQRLDEYFRTIGQQEPVRIVIPKGSYVPVFEPNTPPPPYQPPGPVPAEFALSSPGAPLVSTQPMAGSTAAAASQTPAELHLQLPGTSFQVSAPGPENPPQPHARSQPLQSSPHTAPSPPIPSRFVPGLLVGAVLAAAGLWLLLTLVPGLTGRWFPSVANAARHQTGPEQRFWEALFDPRRAAIIVPADSTLILIEELTGTPVPLQGYLSRQYLDHMPLAVPGHSSLTSGDLATSHYTSMADLNLVSRLSAVPQMAAAHVAIRSARELSISDAKEDNLVLIGGARANPWVELFAAHMDFYVDYNWTTRQNVVINKAPRPGEMPLYAEISTDPAHRVYGLIAYQPSLDHEGDALLVAGTSSAGTQSAADFLLNGNTFGAFLHSIQRPNGSIPHFEILLQARSLGGNVPQSTVIASRLLLQP